MRNVTLCVLLRDVPERQILLGRKKTGFGAGRYNMFGGKCNLGEDLESAALRELGEEVRVTTSRDMLRKVGELTFVFPAVPDWDQVVHVYVVREWVGEPQETEEMAPEWCAVAKIPYEHMWPADCHWLPRVLEGRYVTAKFEYARDQKTILSKEIR